MLQSMLNPVWIYSSYYIVYNFDRLKNLIKAHQIKTFLDQNYTYMSWQLIPIYSLKQKLIVIISYDLDQTQMDLHFVGH